MFCQNCGERLVDGVKYCPNCGAQINKEVVTEVVSTPSAPREARCWSVFAKVGFGLGLGGLIGCILFGLGFVVSIHGIVFSALGKRSSTMHNKARTGLILSIIGTAVGVFIYYLCIYLLGLYIEGASQY